MTVRSNKKSIATVKIKKKSGKVAGFKVTAKKAGKATIIIKVKAGSYKGTYKCKVTVKKKPVKKPKATAKVTATKTPEQNPTEKPMTGKDVTISVMDEENGNAICGASITILTDDNAVEDVTLSEDDSKYETKLEKGQYTVKVSKAGYQSKETEFMLSGFETEAVSLTVKLKKDTTAPTIKNMTFGNKGKSILLTADEPVVASDTAAITVTDSKDQAVAMDTPAVSAGGYTVEITTADNTKLPDGLYNISNITGITDLAGNALTGSISEEKKTTYDAITITSEGFAPAPGQSVSYHITDNYGEVYTAVSNLPNSKDMTVKVSVSNLGVDGNIDIPMLINSTENSFDLSTLKTGYQIKVKVELSGSSLSNPKTDAKTFKIGDAVEATSFAENGAFSLKQESGVGTDNYSVDYGTEDHPIRFGKDSGKKAKIQLLMRDQYNNIMQSTKDQVVTLSSDNPDVIALLDSSGKKVNLVRETGEEDDSILWNNIVIVGIGTTTLHAYLDNGKEAKMNVTVKPPKLEGITTSYRAASQVHEEKNILASYFTFNYDEDKPGSYKTPKTDLTLSVKDVTGNATAEDVELLKVNGNDDGSFKSLTIKANKAAVYTLTLSSANENQSKDFDVTVTPDEEVTDIQLDQAALDIKNGGKAQKVKLNLINKYGDVIAPKTKTEIESIIDRRLLEDSGRQCDDQDSIITCKYLKEDGTVATESQDRVSSLSLTYNSTDANKYLFEVYLKNNPNSKAVIALTGTVATLTAISITQNITAADKLIAKDATTTKYIKLDVTDQDGEEMTYDEGRILSADVSDPTDPDTPVNLQTDVVKAKYQDDKIVETDESGDSVFYALKVDPSDIDDNEDAITYQVTVKYTGKTKDVVSGSKSIKVCEIRKLDSASVDPSAQTVIVGNEANVNITVLDQYKDKLNGVTLQETSDSKSATDRIATAAIGAWDSETETYPVKLATKATGTATKTFSILHAAKDNGTNQPITKSVSMAVTVSDPSELAGVTVNNDNLDLRQINFHDEWNEIYLDLTGIDQSGNEIIMNPSNVVFDYDSMPAYIKFDRSTGKIGVDENSPALKSADDREIPVRIMSGSKEVGNFTIRFISAAPTPETIEESFTTDDPLFAQPLTLPNDGTEYNISDKPFVVTTSYGDPVTVYAKDFVDDECKSTNSKVQFRKENGIVTVSVDKTALTGSTAELSGVYYDEKSGIRKTAYFTVTVKDAEKTPMTPEEVFETTDITANFGVRATQFSNAYYNKSVGANLEIDDAICYFSIPMAAGASKHADDIMRVYLDDEPLSGDGMKVSVGNNNFITLPDYKVQDDQLLISYIFVALHNTDQEGNMKFMVRFLDNTTAEAILNVSELADDLKCTSLIANSGENATVKIQSTNSNQNITACTLELTKDSENESSWKHMVLFGFEGQNENSYYCTKKQTDAGVSYGFTQAENANGDLGYYPSRFGTGTVTTAYTIATTDRHGVATINITKQDQTTE